MKAHSTRLNATLCCKNMDIVELSNIIAKWAKEEALVTRAYVFGSRARNNFQVDSDLDVAVEIKKRPGDENVLATWIFEHKGMDERLAKLLPYKLQLENLDGTNTPTILNGVKKSSIIVYEESEG